MGWPDIAIWAAFAAAQIADVLTTRRVLDQGGRELNPVVAFLMDHLGQKWWMAKLALVWAAGLALWWFGLPWAVLAIAIVTGAVAMNNWREARR